jgi:hypothetical protein
MGLLARIFRLETDSGPRQQAAVAGAALVHALRQLIDLFLFMSAAGALPFGALPLDQLEYRCQLAFALQQQRSRLSDLMLGLLGLVRLLLHRLIQPLHEAAIAQQGLPG